MQSTNGDSNLDAGILGGKENGKAVLEVKI